MKVNAMNVHFGNWCDEMCPIDVCSHCSSMLTSTDVVGMWRISSHSLSLSLSLSPPPPSNSYLPLPLPPPPSPSSLLKVVVGSYDQVFPAVDEGAKDVDDNCKFIRANGWWVTS